MENSKILYAGTVHVTGLKMQKLSMVSVCGTRKRTMQVQDVTKININKNIAFHFAQIRAVVAVTRIKHAKAGWALVCWYPATHGKRFGTQLNQFPHDARYFFLSRLVGLCLRSQIGFRYNICARNFSFYSDACSMIHAKQKKCCIFWKLGISAKSYSSPLFHCSMHPFCVLRYKFWSKFCICVRLIYFFCCCGWKLNSRMKVGNSHRLFQTMNKQWRNC